MKRNHEKPANYDGTRKRDKGGQGETNHDGTSFRKHEDPHQPSLLGKPYWKRIIG